VSRILAMTGEPKPEQTLDARLVAELPRLRDFVRKLLGSAAADVDDVMQEVAARAWRYRDAFDGERALGPWLRGAALRVVFDQRARHARAPRSSDAAVDSLAAETPKAQAWEQRETLARALEQLSSVERDVLVRFHARGESVREIAAALAVPEGTIKSHLHRARRKLAALGASEDES
jgi:RNA polymerase sigma-70 factor (ECF subfamily)